MAKAIVAAIVVYILGDGVWSFLLGQVGLSYLHAFLAMLGGMFVGGFLAKQQPFVVTAIAISIVLSLVNYVLVANMRDQNLLDLILEQHPMVSVGSVVGAALGAWLGQTLAQRREGESRI